MWLMILNILLIYLTVLRGFDCVLNDQEQDTKQRESEFSELSYFKFWSKQLCRQNCLPVLALHVHDLYLLTVRMGYWAVWLSFFDYLIYYKHPFHSLVCLWNQKAGSTVLLFNHSKEFLHMYSRILISRLRFFQIVYNSNQTQLLVTSQTL